MKSGFGHSYLRGSGPFLLQQSNFIRNLHAEIHRFAPDRRNLHHSRLAGGERGLRPGAAHIANVHGKGKPIAPYIATVNVRFVPPTD
jgi:hypothetical protein